LKGPGFSSAEETAYEMRLYRLRKKALDEVSSCIGICRG